MYMSAKSFNFLEFIQMLADFNTVVANLDECGWDTSIYDIENFCMSNNCNGMAMFQNLMGSMFDAFGQVNDIVSVLTHFPGDTEAALYDQTEALGVAFANILKMMFKITTL